MTLQKVNVCARTDCALPIRSRGLCNRHYEAHRRRMLAYGKWESQKVLAAPVREHYLALLDAGMSRNQVSRISGVKADQLDNLLRPRKDRGDQPAKVVFRRTADRLVAVPVPAPHEVWRYAADGQKVDPTGTARRLQALIALGWTSRELSARLGIFESNLPAILHAQRHTTAGFARKVADLFNKLQLTPGTSTRSRNRAARNGWAMPLAWDENSIDDPAAEPVTDPAVTEPALDDIAVERGVHWLLTRPTGQHTTPQLRTWKDARPKLTRSERIAVAARVAGEVSTSMACAALGLRRTDLEHLEAAS